MLQFYMMRLETVWTKIQYHIEYNILSWVFYYNFSHLEKKKSMHLFWSDISTYVGVVWSL